MHGCVMPCIQVSAVWQWKNPHWAPERQSVRWRTQALRTGLAFTLPVGYARPGSGM